MIPDSLTYEQFKIAFLNMDVAEPYRFTQDDGFVPSMVLTGTFAVNSAIIMNYQTLGMSKTSCVHLTTLIFIAGGLLSTASYFLFK